jgi:hypothetical protein
LVVAAFSTAPSSLCGLYERHEHLSSLTITFVYAVYAVGIVVSLLSAVSDWNGRRAVLLSALAVAVLAAVVFLVWRSLAGLLVAPVLTGLAFGAAVATATAFITDLDAGPGGVATRRGRNRGHNREHRWLGSRCTDRRSACPLCRAPTDALVHSLLAALVVAVFLVTLARTAMQPFIPGRGITPAAGSASGRTSAVPRSTTGAIMSFAIFGLFAGLAGAFLAGPLHHPSPALTGLTIFLTFGTGVGAISDHALAGAPLGRGWDRSDGRWAGRAGRLGVDIDS